MSGLVATLHNFVELKKRAVVGTICTEPFFSKRTQLPIFNKYNLNLCALNNFEIGKVELVLNKLLIYLMALFNNA